MSPPVVALPGGATPAALPALPPIVGGAIAGGLGALGFLGGGDLPDLPFGGAVFRARGERITAKRTVEFRHPVTGNIVTYRNIGRPVLYSGDFAAAKRVAKVAGKARRRSGGR
jgi:hypothetical protein